MTEQLRANRYVPEGVPDSDLEHFDPDIDREFGWGEKPALLIIDMTLAFVSGEYPSGRTDTGRAAVEATDELLEAARAKGIPVFFTKPQDQNVSSASTGETDVLDSNRTETKRKHWAEGNDIVEPLTPLGDEVVIEKPCASAFFDTHLSNQLRDYGIDTLIVTGMTTSGCVRATVVDASSSNFRVIIPVECVADRSIVSHEISLFDVDMKYADVVPLKDVIETFGERCREEGAGQDSSC